ncbi:MAG: adenosine deaminase [Rhodospirillaceae bacterium]|nr:adenosine deaminase [Rhodospirillaceae bacterium]
MKKAIVSALLCAVAAAFISCMPVSAQVAPARTDYQATRQYYDSLIAGPSPNLAALTLLMTSMPKGGDLHHHYSGAIYAETYLDWMKQKNYCIYRADNVELKAIKFSIQPNPGSLDPAARVLCLDVDQVRDSSDETFYRELLSRWSDKDYKDHFQRQVAPDQHFFDTFGYFGAFSDLDYNQGLRDLKVRAIAENVQYIETMLRSAPAPDNPALSKAVNELPANASRAQVEATLAPLYEFLIADTATAKGVAGYLDSVDATAAGIDDGDFKMRFQAYVVRGETPARVFSGLYSSFAAVNARRRVVAVNIVGPENGIVAMRDYSLHMRMFAFLKQKHPDVRLALHAGELTLGMVPPEGLQSHIREAVEVAGADRIGHGVDIVYERDAVGLLRTMRERRVAVEINLTSNAFILGVKNEAHPVQVYRQQGVPFVISTDDPGVSRNNLSGEYVLYTSRYKPSYDALKETVFNSIRYSFLSEAEKAAELKALTQRFAAFEARARELANGAPTKQK